LCRLPSPCVYGARETVGKIDGQLIFKREEDEAQAATTLPRTMTPRNIHVDDGVLADDWKDFKNREREGREADAAENEPRREAAEDIDEEDGCHEVVWRTRRNREASRTVVMQVQSPRARTGAENNAQPSWHAAAGEAPEKACDERHGAERGKYPKERARGVTPRKTPSKRNGVK